MSNDKDDLSMSCINRAVLCDIRRYIHSRGDELFDIESVALCGRISHAGNHDIVAATATAATATAATDTAAAISLLSLEHSGVDESDIYMRKGKSLMEAHQHQHSYAVAAVGSSTSSDIPSILALSEIRSALVNPIRYPDKFRSSAVTLEEFMTSNDKLTQAQSEIDIYNYKRIIRKPLEADFTDWGIDMILSMATSVLESNYSFVLQVASITKRMLSRKPAFWLSSQSSLRPFYLTDDSLQRMVDFFFSCTHLPSSFSNILSLGFFEIIVGIVVSRGRLCDILRCIMQLSKDTWLECGSVLVDPILNWLKQLSRIPCVPVVTPLEIVNLRNVPYLLKNGAILDIAVGGSSGDVYALTARGLSRVRFSYNCVAKDLLFIPWPKSNSFCSIAANAEAVYVLYNDALCSEYFIEMRDNCSLKMLRRYRMCKPEHVKGHIMKLFNYGSDIAMLIGTVSDEGSQFIFYRSLFFSKNEECDVGNFEAADPVRLGIRTAVASLPLEPRLCWRLSDSQIILPCSCNDDDFSKARFTMEMWARVGSESESAALVLNRYFALDIVGSSIVLYSRESGTYFEAVSTLLPGVWAHLAVTYCPLLSTSHFSKSSTDTGGWTLYRDGQRMNLSVASRGVIPPCAENAEKSEKATVARRPVAALGILTTGSVCLVGAGARCIDVAEIKLSWTLRSAEEIRESMHWSTAFTISHLRQQSIAGSYWPLNEGFGSIAYNNSPVGESIVGVHGVLCSSYSKGTQYGSSLEHWILASDLPLSDVAASDACEYLINLPIRSLSVTFIDLDAGILALACTYHQSSLLPYGFDSANEALVFYVNTNNGELMSQSLASPWWTSNIADDQALFCCTDEYQGDVVLYSAVREGFSRLPLHREVTASSNKKGLLFGGAITWASRVAAFGDIATGVALVPPGSHVTYQDVSDTLWSCLDRVILLRDSGADVSRYSDFIHASSFVSMNTSSESNNVLYDILTVAISELKGIVRALERLIDTSNAHILISPALTRRSCAILRVLTSNLRHLKLCTAERYHETLSALEEIVIRIIDGDVAHADDLWSMSLKPCEHLLRNEFLPSTTTLVGDLRAAEMRWQQLRMEARDVLLAISSLNVSMCPHPQKSLHQFTLSTPVMTAHSKFLLMLAEIDYYICSPTVVVDVLGMTEAACDNKSFEGSIDTNNCTESPPLTPRLRVGLEIFENLTRMLWEASETVVRSSSYGTESSLIYATCLAKLCARLAEEYMVWCFTESDATSLLCRQEILCRMCSAFIGGAASFIDPAVTSTVSPPPTKEKSTVTHQRLLNLRYVGVIGPIMLTVVGLHAALPNWLESLRNPSLLTRLCAPLTHLVDAVATVLNSGNDEYCEAIHNYSCGMSSRSVVKSCDFVVESEHPYSANADIKNEVSFPGASKFILTFDSRSFILPADSNSLQVTYKTYNGSLVTRAWTGHYGSGFPSQPVIISDTDTLNFIFESANHTNWGFRITIKAIIDIEVPIISWMLDLAATISNCVGSVIASALIESPHLRLPNKLATWLASPLFEHGLMISLSDETNLNVDEISLYRRFIDGDGDAGVKLLVEECRRLAPLPRHLQGDSFETPVVAAFAAALWHLRALTEAEEWIVLSTFFENDEDDDVGVSRKSLGSFPSRILRIYQQVSHAVAGWLSMERHRRIAAKNEQEITISSDDGDNDNLECHALYQRALFLMNVLPMSSPRSDCGHDDLSTDNSINGEFSWRWEVLDENISGVQKLRQLSEHVRSRGNDPSPVDYVLRFLLDTDVTADVGVKESSRKPGVEEYLQNANTDSTRCSFTDLRQHVTLRRSIGEKRTVAADCAVSLIGACNRIHAAFVADALSPIVRAMDLTEHTNATPDRLWHFLDGLAGTGDATSSRIRIAIDRLILRVLECIDADVILNVHQQSSHSDTLSYSEKIKHAHGNYRLTLLKILNLRWQPHDHDMLVSCKMPERLLNMCTLPWRHMVPSDDSIDFENVSIPLKLLFSDGGQYGNSCGPINVIDDDVSHVYCTESGRCQNVNIAFQTVPSFSPSSVLSESDDGLVEISGFVVCSPSSEYSCPVRSGMFFVLKRVPDSLDLFTEMLRPFNDWTLTDYLSYCQHQHENPGKSVWPLTIPNGNVLSPPSAQVMAAMESMSSFDIVEPLAFFDFGTSSICSRSIELAARKVSRGCVVAFKALSASYDVSNDGGTVSYYERDSNIDIANMRALKSVPRMDFEQELFSMTAWRLFSAHALSGALESRRLFEAHTSIGMTDGSGYEENRLALMSTKLIIDKLELLLFIIFSFYDGTSRDEENEVNGRITVGTLSIYRASAFIMHLLCLLGSLLQATSDNISAALSSEGLVPLLACARLPWCTGGRFHRIFELALGLLRNLARNPGFTPILVDSALALDVARCQNHDNKAWGTPIPRSFIFEALQSRSGNSCPPGYSFIAFLGGLIIPKCKVLSSPHHTAATAAELLCDLASDGRYHMWRSVLSTILDHLTNDIESNSQSKSKSGLVLLLSILGGIPRLLRPGVSARIIGDAADVNCNDISQNSFLPASPKILGAPSLVGTEVIVLRITPPRCQPRCDLMGMASSTAVVVDHVGSYHIIKALQLVPLPFGLVNPDHIPLLLRIVCLLLEDIHCSTSSSQYVCFLALTALLRHLDGCGDSESKRSADKVSSQVLDAGLFAPLVSLALSRQPRLTFAAGAYQLSSTLLLEELVSRIRYRCDTVSTPVSGHSYDDDDFGVLKEIWKSLLGNRFDFSVAEVKVDSSDVSVEGSTHTSHSCLNIVHQSAENASCVSISESIDSDTDEEDEELQQLTKEDIFGCNRTCGDSDNEALCKFIRDISAQLEFISPKLKSISEHELTMANMESIRRLVCPEPLNIEKSPDDTVPGLPLLTPLLHMPPVYDVVRPWLSPSKQEPSFNLAVDSETMISAECMERVLLERDSEINEVHHDIGYHGNDDDKHGSEPIVSIKLLQGACMRGANCVDVMSDETSRLLCSLVARRLSVMLLYRWPPLHNINEEVSASRIAELLIGCGAFCGVKAMSKSLRGLLSANTCTLGDNGVVSDMNTEKRTGDVVVGMLFNDAMLSLSESSGCTFYHEGSSTLRRHVERSFELPTSLSPQIAPAAMYPRGILENNDAEPTLLRSLGSMSWEFCWDDEQRPVWRTKKQYIANLYAASPFPPLAPIAGLPKRDAMLKPLSEMLNMTTVNGENITSSAINALNYVGTITMDTLSDLCYFEVTVLSTGTCNTIGIGMGIAREEILLHARNSMVGWTSNTYGYHSDNGKFYNSSGQGKSYGPAWRTGDIIGCGWLRSRHKLFFIRNGTLLGLKSTARENDLRPIISLASHGESVFVNLGQVPFLTPLHVAAISAIFESPLSEVEKSARLSLIQSRVIELGTCIASTILSMPFADVAYSRASIRSLASACHVTVGSSRHSSVTALSLLLRHGNRFPIEERDQYMLMPLWTSFADSFRLAAPTAPSRFIGAPVPRDIASLILLFAVTVKTARAWEQVPIVLLPLSELRKHYSTLETCRVKSNLNCRVMTNVPDLGALNKKLFECSYRYLFSPCSSDEYDNATFTERFKDFSEAQIAILLTLAAEDAIECLAEGRELPRPFRLTTMNGKESSEKLSYTNPLLNVPISLLPSPVASSLVVDGRIVTVQRGLCGAVCSRGVGSGRYYCEVEVVHFPDADYEDLYDSYDSDDHDTHDNCILVGWVTASRVQFNDIDDNAIGNDDSSWAISYGLHGDSVEFRHDGIDVPLHTSLWNDGDILGIGVDRDAHSMTFWHNGNIMYIHYYDDVPADGVELRPAAYTSCRGAVKFSFSPCNLRFLPKTYSPLISDKCESNHNSPSMSLRECVSSIPWLRSLLAWYGSPGDYCAHLRDWALPESQCMSGTRHPPDQTAAIVALVDETAQNLFETSSSARAISSSLESVESMALAEASWLLSSSFNVSPSMLCHHASIEHIPPSELEEKALQLARVSWVTCRAIQWTDLIPITLDADSRTAERDCSSHSNEEKQQASLVHLLVSGQRRCFLLRSFRLASSFSMLSFTMQSHSKENNCVQVNRGCATAHKSNSMRDPVGCSSVFYQLYLQAQPRGPDILNTSKDWCSVKLLGEGADDYGGPFREILSDACSELMSNTTPLFVRSSNHTNAWGEHQEAFVPSPAASTPWHLDQFTFLGRMMGAAIRSQEHLWLLFPPFIWKQLCFEEVTWNDFEGVDHGCVQALRMVANCHKEGITEHTFSDAFDQCFSTMLSCGSVVELVPGGAVRQVTFADRDLYIQLVRDVRMNEFRPQVRALRDGLLSTIPLLTVVMLRWYELERLVAGTRDIDLNELRRFTRFEGFDASDERISMLWDVLATFTIDERRQFLRFVTGRSCLPVKIKVLPKYLRRSDNPDDYLVTSQTCFFSLELPKYSSADIMAKKLRFAIMHCFSIDADYIPTSDYS